MSDYWVSWSEVGFWDRLLDGELRQRRDINTALDQEEVLSANVSTIQTTVDQLRRAVFEMQVMNTVLLRMLSEAGQLDLTVLKYRVEAEVDAIADAKAHPPAPPPAGPLERTCPRCKQVVPAARTTMTESGLVCDGCLR